MDVTPLFWRTPVLIKNGVRAVHPCEIWLEVYIKPMGMSVRALSMALQAAHDLRMAEKQSAKLIFREIAPYEEVVA